MGEGCGKMKNQPCTGQKQSWGSTESELQRVWGRPTTREIMS